MPQQAYKLQETLQEGRIRLCRAQRSADLQLVILKIPDSNRYSSADLERLKNEYELGPTLAGSAIVTPLALTKFGGLPALEFENFHGRTLEVFVGRQMPVLRFLQVAACIAAAVSSIHERGVVHKNLKPSNILLNDRDEVRLIDFCIASRIAREGVTSRFTSMLEGSPPYISPEQTGRMNRALDSRSDLYSLGVIFYQLLTGQLPFEANDPVGWIHCHVACTPISPSKLRPELPAILSELVLKLLSKAPDDRYQTAAGLERDLKHCLLQLQETGYSAPFVLGKYDISDRFLIPQKLYGRTVETAALADAFKRMATTGRSELILLSGSSGTGKSAIVQEMRRLVVNRSGSFVGGKFNLHQQDIPYSAVIQAFRELALDILAESEERITACRQLVTTALGKNAQLIIDLIPEVGLILGPQPAVPELLLPEAQTRLQKTLIQFFGAMVRYQQSLTIFLDDLQWADTSSLKLIADLMDAADVHLLIIGAYRDNVDSTHPLSQTIEDLRTKGAAVRSIAVKPLHRVDIDQLISETVHCSLVKVASLSRLVFEKTGGNPFFTIQFLTTLHQQGMISFDRSKNQWTWDTKRIHAQGHTDNVVELMISKLRALPTQTQNALRLAASVSTPVDMDTFTIIMQCNVEPVLRAALEENLLLRVDHEYRFPHDRVQEAAYSLIPESERAATHLQIGRLLLAHTPREQLEEKSFEIANQLNYGSALIFSAEECEKLAEINLIAGKRAKKSTAYASALTYLVAGSDLLDEDICGRRYDLAFELEFHRAQCERLTGDLDAAEKRLSALLRKGLSFKNAATVTSLQCDIYITWGCLDRAVEAFLEYMRQVGVDWSLHPTNEEVNREFDQVWRQLGNRSIEELVNLPPMTDEVTGAIIEFMAHVHPALHFFDANLNTLAFGRMVNLSLQQGNSDASGMAYVFFGALLGSRFGDYQSGYRFGKAGLELVEKQGLLRFQSRVYINFGSLISPHSRHFHEGALLVRRAYDTAREASDLSDACYARNAFTTSLLAEGAPLGEVQLETENALHFVQKAKFGMMIDIIDSKLRLIRMLRGQTYNSFLIAALSDDARSKQLESEQNPVANCWYFIRALQERYHQGDYSSAITAATKAETLLWTSPSFVEEMEYYFYAALARAAQCDYAPASQLPEHRQALLALKCQIDVWAQSCPENFCDRAALIGAEIARLDSNVLVAEMLYEQAIRSAHENGFVHHEALAFETASRFYRGRGFVVLADAYLREARDRYLRWGAEGKVRLLERQYPQLAENLAPGSSATIALRPEQLDLLSVVKASQTISGSLVRKSLVHTLLQVVIEQSGARRARLFFVHDGNLDLAAGVDAEKVEQEAHDATAPMSILQYVQHTQERVLFHDATVNAGRFSHDEYLVRNCPRSLLCFPIRQQAKAAALIYLENDLLPGAFTPERLLTLELLASQAAISLENQMLLEHEHAGRVEAENARERALLLAEATALMSSSGEDYRDIFRELLKLCVRSFAEWVIIDVVEEHSVARAGAHRDPTKEHIFHDLTLRYPARLGMRAPASMVLADGESRFFPSLTKAEIRSYCVNDEHAALIEQLGTRCIIVVPMVARSERLGALTFGAASPNQFSKADLEFAAELARRAALAVDNARLLYNTRQALQLRDEFLSVASHELRTPIQSLQLVVQSLEHSISKGSSISPRMLNIAVQQSKRLSTLVSQLLDVTRIQRDQLVLTKEKFDLVIDTHQLLDHMQGQIEKSGSRVEIHAKEAAIAIEGDRSRIEQLLTNLLSNALTFGANQPIDLDLEQVVSKESCHARITVRDRGIGIPAERLLHIFERFERATAPRHYGGLGLGLYIAKQIVQAHGGTISVESVVGQGSTFTVKLPC